MKCECGCGQEARPGNRFINGHNGVTRRGKHPHGKYQRNADILRAGDHGGRGALFALAHDYGISHQRVYEIYNREKKRAQNGGNGEEQGLRRAA